MLKLIIIIGIIYAIYQGYRVFAAHQAQEEQRQLDVARNATAVKEILSDIETAFHASADSIDVVMDVDHDGGDYYSFYLVKLTFNFHSKELVSLHSHIMEQFNNAIRNGKDLTRDGTLKAFDKKLLSALFLNGEIPDRYPTFTEFKTNGDSLFASFYRGNAKNSTLENTLIIMDNAAEKARKQYPNMRIIVNKPH